MSEASLIALVSLALILPTASILPFVLHTLASVKALNERLNNIEAALKCPFKP